MTPAAQAMETVEWQRLVMEQAAIFMSVPKVLLFCRILHLQEEAMAQQQSPEKSSLRLDS